MKTAGIVAEYNPFHNGHAHHLARTREAGYSHIIVCMSGSFVQRGEPALLSKAARVRAALQGGADLVLELPVAWSMASAEAFAWGAVSILHALGCVDALSFGSECADLTLLRAAAAACDAPGFPAALAAHLAKGLPFPRARELAVRDIDAAACAPLRAPNDTLAVEYLRALSRLSSPMASLCIPREKIAHDANIPSGQMASASMLRDLIREGKIKQATQYMPPASVAVLEEEMAAGRAPSSLMLIERAILARLRTMSRAEIMALPDVSEGLEHRIEACTRTAGSLTDLYAAVKTKRYTHARVRRICMAAFLGLRADMARKSPPYIRVLGLTPRGREILSAAAGKTSLPMISRAAEMLALTGFGGDVFAAECRASDLYALSLPAPGPCGSELTAGVITTQRNPEPALL